MNRLTIIQHNVNHWTGNKRYELYNTYRHINPDIILINHHALIDNTPLKIFQYKTYTSNKTNSEHRGTAIAIKTNIAHKILDDFDTDLLAVEIETREGPIIIATDYIGPGPQAYMNMIDYSKLIDSPHPAYILGDLNAKHYSLGNRHSNTVGNTISSLMSRGELNHLGPHFPTYLSHNCATTPDITISNNKTYHNFHLTQGPQSSSDHIPVIATTTINPIQIPIKPRPQFNKGDWTRYKAILEERLIIPDKINPTKDDLDNYVNKFDNEIKQASEKCIPVLRYRI